MEEKKEINFLFFLFLCTIERKGERKEAASGEDGRGVGGEKIKSWKVEEKKEVGKMMNIHMNEGNRRNEGHKKKKR